MASYNPPNEYITQFNTQLFNQPDETLSAGEISLLYLTKATASSTYVSKINSVNESINGVKTFTGTIKSNDYDTNTGTAILNIGASVTSGEIKIGRNKTSGFISIGSIFGQLSVYCATSLETTTIQNGSDFGVRNITSADPASTNHTLFNNMTINGVLTIGNALSSNTINGATTFNQAVSVTGLLTATGGLKCNAITPLVGSGQNDIYSSLPTGGTIVFGTASRTMNVYGNVNMVNSCQFSGSLLTNDISFASGQGGGAKNIYTGLTTSGSITIGATTANTTTNLRGGAINIGGSANILTIDSPATFNNTLKTDDITAITTNGPQNIYTTLTSSGSITIGSNTANTTTNIRGGEISIGNSAYNLTIESPTQFNSTLKTDDITAITLDGPQNIYTTLTASGTINLGSAIANTTTNVTGGFLNLGSTNFDTRINSTTTNFTSSGALTIGASVAPASFSFFSSLTNTTINFFNGLTSGTIDFCSSSTMSTMFNLNARVKLRTYKLIEELQTLTTTSETLVFPLQETTIFTNTSNITATLPEITNDGQLGLKFNFLNLGSITTTTTFAVTGINNKIIPYGQMTQYTSVAVINNTQTGCYFVIGKLGSTYVWAEY